MSFVTDIFAAGCVCLAAAASHALAADPVRVETHSSLQAVTAAGASAWTGSTPFAMRGVLLCNPDEMLDSTPFFIPWNDGANPSRMGGEWQIVFQAVDPGDRGGTTCWMGQNYGNQPWLRDSELSYSNPAWAEEVLRLGSDPATQRPFQAGDLIEVLVRQSLFYGGKRNINEAHDIDPGANFELRLVAANHGVPAPEVITLLDVMRPGGTPADRATWLPIFDSTRMIGGERWQGMRVRINGLLLVTTNGWNRTNAWAARVCTVTDGQGRYFTLRHPRYELGPPPPGSFDAIGIFTQESGSGVQGTNGYELFVQQVLPRASGPVLEVRHGLTLSWAESGDRYQLESRDRVNTGVWLPVTNRSTEVEGYHTVTLPPSSAQQYFRLRKVE